MKAISNMGIVFRLLKMVKPLLPIMVVSICSGIAGHLAAIGLLGTGAFLVASLAGMETGVSVQVMMVTVAVCAAARAVFGYIEQYFGHDVAFRLLAIIRSNIFNAIRRLAPAKMANKKSGDMVSTIMSDVEYIEVFFAHTIAPVVIGIVVPALVVCFAGSFWYGFALILLPVYVFIGCVMPMITNRVSRQTGRDYRNNLAQLNSFLIDSLLGLKELLLFGRGTERLEAIGKRHFDANWSLSRLRLHEGMVFASVDALIIGSIGAVLLTGLYRLQAGLLAPGELLIVTVVAAGSFGPVVALSTLSNTLMQTFAAAERIFSLLDEPPLVREGSGRVITPEEASGTIQYSDTAFAYSGSGETILRDINMRIKPGTKAAVVGSSGSGKTTALRLLLRFWDPQRGSILRNDTDIRDIDPVSLRDNICVVSQDTFLFNGSIGDNIRLANPEATDTDIEQAARRASVHDFIARLPKGYQTEVGELGDKLSGGERQRIAIARALLVGAPVILLDEPTSNLDVLNEKRILKTLNEEFASETIIIVSHRTSSIARVDKIYVLEEGRVVETGTHSHLLQQNGSYSRLMNASLLAN